MSLVLPELGLIFWQLVVFGLLFFILTKFAWKPITSALHEREANIDGALKQAELARQEMTKLKSENEALLKEARQEREKMLADARTTSNTIIEEARLLPVPLLSLSARRIERIEQLRGGA